MIAILTERLKHCLQELMYCVGVFHDVHWLWKSVVRLFRAYCICFYVTALWSNFTISTFNRFSSCYSKCIKCFFGYPKYSSVTKVLFDLGLPSFSTMIHNSKVSFASRLSVCDDNIVRCVSWVCFVSFCLSLFVWSFFCICCMCRSG